MLPCTLRPLAVFLLCGALAAALIASPAAQAQGLEGAPAPALELPDPQGVERSLGDLAQGRPVIVLFWASWCPYCKALMPHLQSILDEHGTDRVEVVAVNLWEDGPEDWRADFVASGYDFQVLLGGDDLAKAWGVKGTPGLFLIDARGKVVFDRNARAFEPSRRDATLLEGEQGNRQKAARQAPLWAAELRKTLDKTLSGPK